MYYSFTDGKVLDVPDRCGYCGGATDGQHQLNCPAFPPALKYYFHSKIRIFKYDDEGNFIKEL